MTDYVLRSDIAAYVIDHCIELSLRDWLLLGRAIKSVPVADVAPVRHAHWVYKRRRSGGFRVRDGIQKNWERVKVLIDERTDTMEPFCSVCGAHNDSTNELNMCYCPHCGAKMDEEVNKTCDLQT